MRAKLEDLKELRDLVRSLGRGGGWGPLRRAPIQYLDMRGRPGLLRTVLEQQETRGLTRSDDISRLLPSEVRQLCRKSRAQLHWSASRSCHSPLLAPHNPARLRRSHELTICHHCTAARPLHDVLAVRPDRPRPQQPAGEAAVLRQAGGEGAWHL